MAILAKEEELYFELVAQLIAYRGERGWSQKRIALESGLDPSVYKRLENLGVIARTTTILKTLEAMDLKLVIMPKEVDVNLITNFSRSLVQYKKYVSAAKEIE